jgi:hypothetical protein
MCFYDSIIVFEKGDVWRKVAPQSTAGKLKE